MFDKNLTEEYKNKKMPEDIKNNILESMNAYKTTSPAKKIKSVRRYVLVYAAVFISLAVLVSAAVVYGNMQYVPGKGFVEEGKYEVYATPEIIQFGDAIIETVMRIQEGDKSELAIIITDNRNNFSPDNYKKDLTVTTPDGQIYTVAKCDNPEPEPKDGTVQISSNFLRIIFPDFPAVNEFVISENGASVNISLIENGFDVETGDTGTFGITEQNGITIMMKQLTKGSKIIAYQLEDNNLDFDYLFGERNYFHKRFRLYNIELYDEAGNNCTETGYSGSGTYDYKNKFYDNVLILPKRPEGKIIKMSHNQDFPYIGVSAENINFEKDSDKMIFADVEIPTPADGEETVYDDGLIIYNHKGLTCTLESISRKGKEVTVTTNTKYTGENSENIETLFVRWIHSDSINISGGGGIDGNCETTFKIAGDEEFIKLRIYNVNYSVKGNWEIYFN